MTAERYTVVFTGLLALKKPGEYTFLTMHEDPMVDGSHTMRKGKPPYEKMGREISFDDFPEACRRLVLDTYCELWGL